MKILIKKSKLRTEWMCLTEEQPQEKCTGILENQPKKKNSHNKSRREKSIGDTSRGTMRHRRQNE